MIASGTDSDHDEVPPALEGDALDDVLPMAARSPGEELPPELEAASAELERAQAEIDGLRAQVRARDEQLSSLDRHQPYRFAKALLEAKSDPRSAWKLPIAFAKLVTPRPLRDVVRLSLEKARGRLDEARKRFDSGVDRAARALVHQPSVIHAERWPDDQPLVSVVIPCFNYGRFIDEAVQSVLAQTLTDLEIILVEGGSTDGTTIHRVQLIDHPKVRTIFQPRPTQVAKNRLDGLVAARGKYVVFLDADDLLAPTYLEKAVMALELTGTDIAYPSVQEFGNSHGLWETANEFTLENLSKVHTIATVAMFRRSTWQRLRIGYSMTTVPGLEDFDFWLRFAERGARGHKIHEPLMLYRVHGASLTDSVKAKYPEHLRGILREHKRSLTPRRVAIMTRLQRSLPRVEAPLLNLARLEHTSPASLPIALALPWMVLGGSDSLLLQIFGDVAQRDASLSVFTTLGAPPSMGGSKRADYGKLTPDVFDLPHELPAATHADAVMHLLRSRGTKLLMIVGSALTYDLLPRIHKELPHLKVVDHLYNLYGHFANNRRNAHLIDFHIVANEDVQKALIQAGEPPEKIQVIHHGVDMTRYDYRRLPRRAKGFERLPLELGDKLVLYAGRFSEEKGVLRFVELAHRLRHQKRLVFAMIGDGPQRPEVEARIRKYSLERVVNLLGFVEDSGPYLRRADAVVIPSDVEGLPLVSLEALALGTPVVASRIGALPTVIQCGVNGDLADPAELESYVRALRRTLELDTDRERLAASCRASVVERFGIDAVRSAYFEVFRRLALGGEAPRPPGDGEARPNGEERR